MLQTETEGAPDAVVPIDDFDGTLAIRALSYTPKGGNRPILRDIALARRAGGRQDRDRRPHRQQNDAAEPDLPRAARPGTLFVGGVDLAEVNLRQYRKHLAAVTQSDQLFRGTIRDNITNFAPAPRSARCSMRRSSRAFTTIERLDHRYDTPLGDTQKFLSAGQMQRL